MRGGLHSWNHPGASKYARSSTFGIRARHGYGINGSKVVYTGRGRHDGRSGLDREWHDGRSGLDHSRDQGGPTWKRHPHTLLQHRPHKPRSHLPTFWHAPPRKPVAQQLGQVPLAGPASVVEPLVGPLGVPGSLAASCARARMRLFSFFRSRACSRSTSTTSTTSVLRV